MTPSPHPTDPPWLAEAWKHLGKHEVRDRAWLLTLPRKFARWVAAYYTDTVKQPWCALGLSAWLRDVGYATPTNPLSARAYEYWGESAVHNDRSPTGRGVVIPVYAGLPRGVVRYGAIVVLKRVGGGHVGLLVGYENGQLLLLGANQLNSVSVQRFDPKRALAFRWPVERLS